MIYTSDFENMKKINAIFPHIVPISIVISPPRKYNGLEYRKLSPLYYSLRCYKANHDINRYFSDYEADVLNHLNHGKVIRDLYKISKNEHIALLGYGKFERCHRKLVAEWFTKNGYTVDEIQI